MTAWRFLFISLAVHLIVWYFLLNRPPINFGDDKKVEVTLVEKQTKPKRITRAVDLPPDMLSPTKAKDPKYQSEKDQSVKKETRAKALGLTQNQFHPGVGKDNGPKTSQKKSGRPSEPGEGPKKLDLSEISPNFSDQPVIPPQNPGGGVSTSDDDREIAEGPITALNSERFLYASFFNRFKERIYPLWNRRLEDMHARLPPKRLKELNDREWETTVDVILDPQGHYLETKILRSSGMDEVDQAGVLAFQEGSYYPNPPAELVRPDHKIHLQFTLLYEVRQGWGR